MRSTYRALAMPVGMLAVPVVALAYAPAVAPPAASARAATPRMSLDKLRESYWTSKAFMARSSHDQEESSLIEL